MARTKLLLLLLFLPPLLGMAQSKQDSWADLNQLRPGDKIEVVARSMETLQGSFVSVSEEAITLEVGKHPQSIERAKVVRVSVRDTSHRTRNMLMGAGILGGIALGVAAIPLGASSNEGNSCPVCVGVIAAGFGGGAALGAIPGSRTIYRVKK